MDISGTIQPNSEQVNAEDLLAGEQTVTITAVEAGTKDQPVFIHLKEFPGRTYRPGKSMRRVLVVAWGTEASAYVGRQLTIFNDVNVLWAGKPVGGIRISKMSHIAGAVTVALTVTRGQRKPFVVQPMNVPEKPPQDVVDAVLADLMAASSLESLKAAWDLAGVRGVQSHPDLIAAKEARKAELSAVS